MREIGWIFLNILQSLVLVLWSVVCVIIAFFSRLFGRDLPLHVARLWSVPLLWLGGVRLHIEYEAEIDWKRPHVFVMNHQSMFDIIAAIIAIKAPLRFIAKKSLSYVPFLGWYMRWTGMIFVDRSRTSQAIASLQKAGERIAEGANIIAFPEGTRTRDGRIHPFKKGSFMVALAAQVPIVPIVIEGAYIILPRDGFRLRPGTVRMKVGSPIPTKGLDTNDRDRLIKAVREKILAMHLEVGGKGGAPSPTNHAPSAKQPTPPNHVEEPGSQTA